MSDEPKVVPFQSKLDRPDEDTGPCEVNVPDIGVAGFEGDEVDVGVMLNLRSWLRQALESAGAKQIGGSVGCGIGDVDIELEGCEYVVTIRPIMHNVVVSTDRDEDTK